MLFSKKMPPPASELIKFNCYLILIFIKKLIWFKDFNITYLDPRVKGDFALHNHINGISVLKKRFQES